MDGLIVYGSKYGTTRRYAEELSRLTGLPAIPCGEFHRLAEGSILVYLGALYAGGVLGLKQTMKGLSFREGQRLIVATVGLADPAEPQNRAHIRAALQKQLPPEFLERAVLFHLRGGIDYAVLSPRHRAMMAAMCFSFRGSRRGRGPLRTRHCWRLTGNRSTLPISPRWLPSPERSCADMICWERSAFDQSGR